MAPEKGPVPAKWFGSALQALVVLARSEEPAPSGQIAGSLESDSTFLRRIMALLTREHIVQAREGRDGGYRLAKPAETISLAEVYQALNVIDALSVGLFDSTTDCPLGQGMRKVFDEIAEEVQQSLLRILARYTIADLARSVSNT